MNFAVVFLACVGFLAATKYNDSDSSHNQVKFKDRNYLEKQKFLLEIVYRVEDPLMFEEYIKYGEEFVMDKSLYTNFTISMEKFWESYKMGVLIPKGEFFGVLAKTHAKQALGLFNFFYYAKDFETFKHSVAWARMHINEGMFIYALTLSVLHRKDCEDLMIPGIFEIFPQYFFNSKFIYEAEKFDYDVWSKLNMHKKEFKDVYYNNNNFESFGDYVYMKDWKMWQWWKLMGLGEHWYSEDKFMLRENIYEFNQDSKWMSMMHDLKMFWMPVDYTRDVEFYNEHNKLSYFTEDIGWNSYWYSINMGYSFLLDSKTYGYEMESRGASWLYNVKQLLSRYYMERLSHGFGDIPQFSWFTEIEYGYNPELIDYNGVGFSYRKNYWEYKTYGNLEMLQKIVGAQQRIYNIVDSGIYKTSDGQVIDLRKPKAMEYIGNLLQGNADSFDTYFYQSWYMLAHMYFGDVETNDLLIKPNVMMNFETMMRDPMFYMFYKLIALTYIRFMKFLPQYTKEELYMPGITLKHVDVSKLVTYYDLCDFDVTNLLSDKMVFHDGRFVWDKSLFARQMRLNHKPFTFSYTIESDKGQKVVIRSFLGPKYDEYGRMLSLAENVENFWLLDETVYDLKAGSNVVERNSEDFYGTIKDEITFTEFYKYVMMAYDGKYDNLPLNFSESQDGFPDRLILPKGWSKGMPMQMFFMVTPHSGEEEIDGTTYGYPFDRPIDEYKFFVPNMYFKDIEIYHEDTFKTYYQPAEYKNSGHFDYSFYQNYYTKYLKN